MFIPREPIVVIYSLWKLCQTKESVVDGLSGIREMHDNFPPNVCCTSELCRGDTTRDEASPLLLKPGLTTSDK